MISPHNIGVIFAVIALVVLSAMCILWHYIIRKPYETIVKNTATTARAQARYTPVRYVDGTKKKRCHVQLIRYLPHHKSIYAMRGQWA